MFFQSVWSIQIFWTALIRPVHGSRLNESAVTVTSPSWNPSNRCMSATTRSVPRKSCSITGPWSPCARVAHSVSPISMVPLFLSRKVYTASVTTVSTWAPVSIGNFHSLYSSLIGCHGVLTRLSLIQTSWTSFSSSMTVFKTHSTSSISPVPVMTLSPFTSWSTLLNFWPASWAMLEPRKHPPITFMKADIRTGVGDPPPPW